LSVPFTLKLAIGPPGRRPEFPFDKGEASLGRTADNDLVVKDGDASRQHARIYEKDGRYFLEDLQSANGTQLNGELLQDETKEIRNGDTIGIGAVVFVFTIQNSLEALGPAETFDLPDTVARGGAHAKSQGSDAEPSETKHSPARKYDRTNQRPALRETKKMKDAREERDAHDSEEPVSWEAPPAAPSPPRRPRKPPPSTIRTDEHRLQKSDEPQLVDSQDIEPVKSMDVEAMGSDEPERSAGRREPPPRRRPPPDMTNEEAAPSHMLPPPLPLGGVVDSTARQASPATAKLSPVDDEPGTSHIPTSDQVPIVGDGPGASMDAAALAPPPPRPAASESSTELAAHAGPPPEAAAARVDRSAGLGKKEEENEKRELTAAEKARVRRQAQKTAGGRMLYAWSQLPLPLRLLLSLVMIGGIGVGGYSAWQSMAPVVKVPPPAEPSEIVGGGPTLEASFGTGEGVTYERPDMKVFTFKAVSPTQLVGLLHYQARDVSKEEVAVSVNGYDLGFVAADSIDAEERELELVIPASQVKRNEPNQITFDNVRNPPGHDPWRIWNLWLELLALPDTSSEETLISVKEDLERAQKFFDTRDIGPDNLFKAWKGYRDAWLKLESLPGRPNDLYVVARAQQAEARRLMDKKCKTLQIDVQRVLSARKPDYELARKELKDMLRYFPTREHPCHALVQSQLDQIE
jgi:pSer/pThr/pTyr-binding forkhead associated (FHA) protein